MRVFGLDPGKCNFGVFVGDVNKDISKIKVLYSTMLESPLTELKGDIMEDIESFSAEYRTILYKYKPQVITIERFQTRGFKGLTVELIGVMLGIMMHINSEYAKVCPKLEVRLITAATWKNTVNRRSNLKSVYKTLKKRGVVDHRTDSALMSIYKLTDDPYGFLKVKDQRNKFFKQMVIA